MGGVCKGPSSLCYSMASCEPIRVIVFYYRGVGVQVLKVIMSKSIDEREFFHYIVENITEEDKTRY